MSLTYFSSGARLGYSDAGAGLPVIFLHPTPLDRNYWSPLVDLLPGIRAIVPDLRGHGISELGSDLPVGGFARVPDAPVLTMRQLAVDIFALLDHLGLDAAVFAGCSIGGYVMLEMARIQPARLRGTAFLCSKPQPDAEANLAKRVENIQRVRAEGVAPIFDGTANMVSAATRKNHPELVAAVRAQAKLTADAVVAVQAGLAVRPDSLSTVAALPGKVLAVAGAEDIAVSPQEMEAFRAAPGGCEYSVIPDAGHFAAFEYPQKHAEILAAWLTQFAA